MPRKKPALTFLGKNAVIKSVFDVSKPEKKQIPKNLVKAAALAAENAADKTIDEIKDLPKTNTLEVKKKEADKKE